MGAVDDLINKPVRAEPTPEFLAAVQDILAFNDRVPYAQRHSARRACVALTQDFPEVPCSSSTTLEGICRKYLGRTSWARP